MTKKTGGNVNTETAGRNAPTYAEQIARKDALVELRAAAKKDLIEASSDVKNKRRFAEEAGNEAARFVRAAQDENQRMGRDKNFLDEHQKSQLDKLNKAAETADNAANESNARYRRLTEELNDIESDLGNFNWKIGSNEVLSFQQDLEAAEKRVADIQTLIDQQQAIIEEANVSMQTAAALLKELEGQREDMLAYMALGKGSESSLKELDKRITTATEASDAEARSLANAQSESGAARLTMAGLIRRQEEAAAELDRLRNMKKEIINQYLIHRAEKIGDEYVALSIKLIDSYKQLAALDRLLGHPSRLIGPSSDGFAIPTFRLKAFDGLEQNGYYGQIHAARVVAGPYKDDAVIRSVVEEISAQISAAGIKL